MLFRSQQITLTLCGCSLVVKPQSSTLLLRVRFSPSAPLRDDIQPSNEEILAYLKTKRGKYVKDLIKFLEEKKSAK